MNFKTSVLAAAVAASVAPATLAQSAGEASTLPKVTVSASAVNDDLPLDEGNLTGSRLGLSARETPASVNVVNRARIDKMGAADTQEILQGVPGITAASPPGSAGSVFYRGFGASSLTQLFNGITPQYDAISARPVDSWIYERVEAIGGPSTYLFGAGAVGGSINYVTKIAQRQADSTEARVRYGSYDTSDLAFGLSRRVGSDAGVQHFVRLDANVGHSNGYVDAQVRNTRNVAASWLADITPQMSHTLALEYQNEKVDRPYWGTPVLNPALGELRTDPGTRFKNYNVSDGIYEQTVQWARSLLEYRLSAQTTLRNTAYHYDALRDYRNVETYKFNATNTAVVRSSALLQRHDQVLNGDRVELSHKGTLAGLRSDWAAGLDLSHNTQTRFPRSLSATVSTVNPYDFTVGKFFEVPGMVPGFNPDRTNKVGTVAFFAENRTQLAPQWSLVSGVRHDRITLEGISFQPVTATNPAYFRNVYQPTTGRVGLVFDMSPSANAYLQYSTAADPPAGILTTASFAQVRDFDLTRGRQVELGSKFDFLDGRGSATVAAYTITRQNLAIADQNNPGTTLPVGQQSSKGVEVAAALRLTPTLSVHADLAYVQAQYDKFLENVGGVAVSRAGLVPTNIPDQVANLGFAWRLAEQWEMGADLRQVAKRYANTANTAFVPAYSLFNASLSYQVSTTTRVTLRGKNLGDTVYAASAGTGSLYLGAPRTLELTVQARF